LRFRLRIGAVTAPLTDTLVVSVDGIPVRTFVEPLIPEPAYTLREINLSAFADGGTHALLFRYEHPNPGNASFTVDNVAIVTVPIATDLSITKTDGITTASPGQEVTYTIVASNAGPSAASDARVTDTVSAALGGAAWTCVGAGGGACSAGGSGSIDDAVNLPVGATVTYHLHGTVPLSASGILSNTASVTRGTGPDSNPGNNSATDTDTLQPQASRRDGRARGGMAGQPSYSLMAPDRTRRTADGDGHGTGPPSRARRGPVQARAAACTASGSGPSRTR
jgi:uncharacterized repeat protein (TIGR01451 family)